MPYVSQALEALFGLPFLAAFFLIMAWRVRRRHRTNSRVILTKILAAAILITAWVIVVALAAPHLVLWRRIVGAICVYYAALLYYFAVAQMLQSDGERPVSLVRIRFARTIAALVTLHLIVVALLDIRLGDHAPIFGTAHTGTVSSLYYIEALLNYSGLGVLDALIVRAYWQVLRERTSYISLIYRQERELVYVGCFALCLMGFLTNLVCVCLTDGSLILSWLGDDGHPALISLLYQYSILVMGFFVLTGYTLPDRALISAVRSLDEWRRRQAQDRLRYLHGIMVRVVPQVRFRSATLPGAELQGVFLLLEISEARRIIWSHEERTKPIRPKDEAKLLVRLVRANTRLLAPGSNRPASLHCSSSSDSSSRLRAGDPEVDRHNYAVARRLKRPGGPVTPSAAPPG